jgi:hypothetical protein
MKPALRLAGALVVAGMAAGCLEVNQHPPYANGMYAGKKDDLQYQRVFHDRGAWSAALATRVQGQNEYRRAKP